MIVTILLLIKLGALQDFDLFQIFNLVLQVLRHIESSGQELLAGTLCEKVLVIAEQILSWQFAPVKSE